MKHLSVMFIVFILIILAIFNCSNDSPTSSEESIQQKLKNALDETFSRFQGKGISAAVVLPDGEIWKGTEHIQGSSPITPDQIFWVASITKMFTAALTLQLVDEGKLGLDDSLYKFLPTYPYVDSTITIYQLLTHTSGVFDFPNNPHYSEIINEDPNNIWTPEEIVTRLFDTPYFDPGEGWRYSSGGYVLLGMVIEKVTGNKVSEEFRHRFYEPFGLHSTFFDGQDPITANFANFWADSNNDGIEEEIPVLSTQRLSMTTAAYSAGALFSTAEDIAKWTDDLFGKKLVLSQEMLDYMLDFYTNLPPDFGWLGYGMGAAVFRTSMVDGVYAYGHGGWGAYEISATAYLPAYNASVTILLNSQNWTLWEKSMNALCKVIIDNYD